MSRFYGSMQGNRGEATRQGSADSGINAHIRGWNLGVRVYGFAAGDPEHDTFTVSVSGGSNGTSKVPAFGFTIEETNDGYRVEAGDAVLLYNAEGRLVSQRGRVYGRD